MGLRRQAFDLWSRNAMQDNARRPYVEKYVIVGCQLQTDWRGVVWLTTRRNALPPLGIAFR